MDPRRPLANAAVLEEFVDIFYADLDKRPALVAWLRQNAPPSKLRELERAINEDRAEKKPTFGSAVDARMKTLERL